jgi:hypothetical protein
MSERDLPGDDIVSDVPHDPDKGSTWNTIDGTVEIEEILSEQELEDFMEQPSEDELGIISDSDIPGAPG